MTLEQLQKDMIQAMKDKDTNKKSVLSGAISAIKNAAIAKKCKDNITEELVNEVLLKELKTLNEMIATCPISRNDLLSEYVDKRDALNEYVPKLLDDPKEIESVIRQLCGECHADLTKNNRGPIMKIIMPYFKGKADMKIVNQVITEVLK